MDDAAATLENDEGVLSKKTVVALLIVLGGMVWTYEFFASGAKTTNLMSLSMGLIMIFQGLRELLEDHYAAAAQVFTSIRNACIVLMFVGLVHWFLF